MVSHFFAKVASELWLEASHESAQEKIAKAKQGRNFIETCSAVSRTPAAGKEWQTEVNECTFAMMAEKKTN